MSEEINTVLLRAVLDQYATPDPKIVGTIPRNGINLAYVSHADITKILIEVDPLWNWEPVAWEHGRPAITERDGIATLWVRLTLLGKTMLGCGSVSASKEDLDKELIGDALRNAAMRFGIALALWSNAEWAETDHKPTVETVTRKYVETSPAPQRVPAPANSPFGPTEKQLALIKRLGWNGDPPATKLEASALIERLKAQPEQTAPDDEAPF